MGNGDNLKILAGQGWDKHSCLSIQTRGEAENCLPGTKFFALLQSCKYFAKFDCHRKPQVPSAILPGIRRKRHLQDRYHLNFHHHFLNLPVANPLAIAWSILPENGALD